MPDRYFRPFERINAVVTTSLGALAGDIRPIINQVSEGDMTVLEFCSERLEQMHTEPVIDEQGLENILTEVTTIFDEVKTANIDAALRTFILDGLESIRRGIYEFRIRGPERLKEAVAEIIGDFAVNHPKPQTPEDQDSWNRFNKTFRRFIALGTFAHTGMKFLQAFTGPLLPGGPDEREP